jgi:histidyl-tRNA synthetase
MSPIAIIEGSDERAKGVVTLKDLQLGAQQAREVTDRSQWSKGAEAQVTVARSELVSAVRSILSAQASRK